MYLFEEEKIKKDITILFILKVFYFLFKDEARATGIDSTN